MSDAELFASLFDSSWYRKRYAEQDIGPDAFAHFLTHGRAEGNDPSPLFSTRWYLNAYPDVAASESSPLEHYAQFGMSERRDPSPVFGSAWYFARYPSFDTPEIDAREHYFREGSALGLDPCEWFHTQWYLEKYPHVAKAGTNPLLHYLTEGAWLGYDPCPEFSTTAYLATHPECVASGDNPLVHFLIDRHLGKQQTQVPDYPVSDEAIGQAKLLWTSFGLIESDFNTIPRELEMLPVVPMIPDGSLAAWRNLFLNLFELPTDILLVGQLDAIAELGSCIRPRPGFLVVETDTGAAAIAAALPRGTRWLSLAEFGPELDGELRVRVVTALINGLMPRNITVSGSRVGWEFMLRYGTAMAHRAHLSATIAPTYDLTELEVAREYLRPCLPFLTALYGDPAALSEITQRYQLPLIEQGKLQPLEHLDLTGGMA